MNQPYYWPLGWEGALTDRVHRDRSAEEARKERERLIEVYRYALRVPQAALGLDDCEDVMEAHELFLVWGELWPGRSPHERKRRAVRA